MSVNTVENLCFALHARPELVKELAEDPETVLNRYPLTPEERDDILNWNVRRLNDRGVSGMLLMVAFTALNGQDSMPEYMRRMNQPALASV